MGDNSSTIEIFGIFNIIFFIAFVCVFWGRTFGSIFIWEVFMLYLYCVLIPIGVGLIILLLISLVS